MCEEKSPKGRFSVVPEYKVRSQYVLPGTSPVLDVRIEDRYYGDREIGLLHTPRRVRERVIELRD